MRKPSVKQITDRPNIDESESEVQRPEVDKQTQRGSSADNPEAPLEKISEVTKTLFKNDQLKAL